MLFINNILSIKFYKFVTYNLISFFFNLIFNLKKIIKIKIKF